MSDSSFAASSNFRRVPRFMACALLAVFSVAAASAAALAQEAPGQSTDRLRDLQTRYATNPGAIEPRVYHFGSQGPGKHFTNHRSHSNRMVPIYVFGKKVDLGTVMGKNSRYRDPEKIKEIYGFLPLNTVNPNAEYADQSDIRRVLDESVAKGAKHLFIVWFDGLDWPTTRAAAIAKTGKIYDEGRGAGLFFQDYDAGGATQFGYLVTSPTHNQCVQDVDKQQVVIPPTSLGGGYDFMIAGETPWKLGPFGEKARGYFKGQSANDEDKEGVKQVGRVLHAYTDSSQSAAELVSGVKSYNAGLNIADDGRLITTIFHDLQDQGWKTGTVTSVPFCHASPSGMYAQNVERDDYQDLARAMLGLPGIIQEARQGPLHPGLDVVIGTGYAIPATEKALKLQGANAVPGPIFITDADRAAVDVKNGGKYVTVHTEIGVNGGESLMKAAKAAVEGGHRLFGLYGDDHLDHFPFQTADGRFDPAPSINSSGETLPPERYSPSIIDSQPTLAQATDAALAVVAAKPDQPFILFVEAGDVDFALHANNLDNAIGALYSGEEAIRTIVKWVETHSNWDDTVLVVSSDHGHYMVLDDPQALAGTK